MSSGVSVFRVYDVEEDVSELNIGDCLDESMFVLSEWRSEKGSLVWF